MTLTAGFSVFFECQHRRAQAACNAQFDLPGPGESNAARARRHEGAEEESETDDECVSPLVCHSQQTDDLEDGDMPVNQEPGAAHAAPVAGGHASPSQLEDSQVKEVASSSISPGANAQAAAIEQAEDKSGSQRLAFQAWACSSSWS